MLVTNLKSCQHIEPCASTNLPAIVMLYLTNTKPEEDEFYRQKLFVNMQNKAYNVIEFVTTFKNLP